MWERSCPPRIAAQAFAWTGPSTGDLGSTGTAISLAPCVARCVFSYNSYLITVFSSHNLNRHSRCQLS